MIKNFQQLIEPDRLQWQQILDLLESQGDLPPVKFINSLQKLALGSNYAIKLLIKYPEFMEQLQNTRQFVLPEDQLKQSLQNINDLALIKQKLRYFRHQQLLQIIYLDICLQQPVERSLLHLSQLADLLIKQALLKTEQSLSSKHGQPVDSAGQPMTLNIIGMGKLGGNELNFSSDIDLICCYKEDGQLSGYGKLTYSQFFSQVVKQLKQCLNETTADGFVYRVDLRLRPWGEAGPLVLSHNALEHYYQLHGREWEQYAMVKARVISGNTADKKQLQNIINPFVYRRYHDYRVFDGLAQLKQKIDQQAKQHRTRWNIKTGKGGIREIEFFIQAFQILKGGRHQQLQSPSLLQALHKLLPLENAESEHLIEMRESYCFLRLLENRIQMLNDLQTHELPDNENTQNRLSYLLGYADWSKLTSDLSRQQTRINKLFSTLFTQHADSGKSAIEQNFEEMTESQQLHFLQCKGFSQAEQILNRLLQFYQSPSLRFMSDKAKKRFHAFFPELLKQVAEYRHQRPLLEKMLALLASIAGRSIYFELLYQNIPLLIKLVQQFNSSDWIASEVTRHPILLESILYPGQLQDRFTRTKLQQALQVQLENVINDEELELDVLRQFKRAQTIVIATAEIAGEIDTFQVSLYLSELAEILLQSVYKLSLNALVRQFGKPQCILGDKLYHPELCIIGYGKLGSRELHYQSDLDIIFLHDSSGTSQWTSGAKSIDNAVFFSRLAQKIISKISLLTAAGKLYEIDTRLRPDGASGMLVSSINAYRHYQLEKAWVWEHQAIIRARFIAGSQQLQTPFEQIRKQTLSQPREQATLTKAIIDMREKIYQTRKPAEGKTINIKHSRGCMVDIEFLVQFWILKYANKFASLMESTDNIALIKKLHGLGLISDMDLQLQVIYPAYHRLLHQRVLQNESAEINSELISEDLQLVKCCWKKTFG